ncbi:MAG: hypothetical protein NZ908_03090, partial [Candidatus Micrarchaeota archaeon]|nr:hypothetical protein [Candidatus Micrarchaeota archaeon]
GRRLRVKVEIIDRIEDPQRIIEEIIKYHKLDLRVYRENDVLKVEGAESAKKDLKNLLDYYGIEHDRIQF